MSMFYDFFFDGWAEMLSLIIIVGAVGWFTWAARFNRE